jgi:hypothetical protein
MFRTVSHRDFRTLGPLAGVLLLGVQPPPAFARDLDHGFSAASGLDRDGWANGNSAAGK